MSLRLHALTGISCVQTKLTSSANYTQRLVFMPLRALAVFRRGLVVEKHLVSKEKGLHALTGISCVQTTENLYGLRSDRRTSSCPYGH